MCHATPQSQPDDESRFSARVEALTRINLDDMVEAWGVRGHPVLEWLVRRVGAHAARRFARTVLEADRIILRHGLAAGAVLGLSALNTRLEAHGTEHAPRSGPAIFASNHPGMTDTLALLASIRRDDVRFLAARRPFLETLEGFRSALIWIEEDGSTNRAALRRAVDHLRRGGALITFPAGVIEPDPAVFPGAAESLQHWSHSLDLLARLAPQAAIVPTLVSGVISARAAHSRLRLLRRTRHGQDHLGAMLQLSLPFYRATDAFVHFAPPVRADSTAQTVSASTAAHTMPRSIARAANDATNATITDAAKDAMRLLLTIAAQSYAAKGSRGSRAST